MKNLLLIFGFSFLISCSHKSYVLCYEKEYVSRPLALNQNNFWNLKLDSVIVFNRQHIHEVNELFRKMQLDNGDFSVSYCLITKNKHSDNDTLYADYFFKYWKTKDINYFDSTGKLKTLLTPYIN